MASSSPPSPSDGPQQKQKDEQPPSSPPGKDECGVHKTKTIQFFGRTTPVILQNDNGPCPLLAICNVLLLKNQLNLNPDTSEVSQEKLLSLVAERLIDSNSNVNNKDSGYVENQQQNIADAIDLLPRLTTGIDVNIKFRRIDDFEFTPECAIFDLLDIPLYHGWIVDPQDHETAAAIGSKSYNTLMGELVFLETRKMEKHNDKSEEDCSRKIVKCNDRSEEDSVDFAAATAAALGVPSPCLSRTKSSEDTLCCASYEPKVRKGDAEEEAELVRVLTLSETEQSTKSDSSVMHGYFVENVSDGYDGNVIQMRATLEESTHGMELHNHGERSDQKPSKSGGHVVISTSHDEAQTKGLIPELADSFPSSSSVANDIDHSVAAQVEEVSITTDVSMKPIIDTLVQDEVNVLVGNNSAAVPDSDRVVSLKSTLVVDLHDGVHTQNGLDNSDLTGGNIDIDSLAGQGHSTEATGSFASSLDGNEPIYEGEDCILGSKSTVSKDHEPVYEGEMVLAQRVDNVKDGEPIYEGETVVVEQGSKGGDVSPMVEIIETKGELIRNFLKNSASQLTIYGLFCLQDGLKERELCVFFRNNHFNTMFKYQGELYILATDQGYINQPDLVWEKLNEVNGDTLFMTNNFKEFRLDSQSSAWDQHSAVASTTDYLATLDNSSHSNSDLQLAIALQQQEFEQQPQRHAPQQASGTGSSRLITGPQQQPSRPNVKPSSSSPRQDSKSKEKCTIM